jgi:hypothetical protein
MVRENKGFMVDNYCKYQCEINLVLKGVKEKIVKWCGDGFEEINKMLIIKNSLWLV